MLPCSHMTFFKRIFRSRGEDEQDIQGVMTGDRYLLFFNAFISTATFFLIIYVTFVVLPTTLGTIATNNGKAQTSDTAEKSLEEMAPVAADDHSIGNRDAKVTLVNYSDFLCPFCQKFHDTLQGIEAKYGDRVNFVFRHLPIVGGDNSFALARGAECAVAERGNEAFIEYADLVYAKAGTNKLPGDDFAEAVAKDMGLNVSEFAKCLASDAYDAKIIAQANNGLAMGVEGTPFSVIVASDGTKYPVNGAQSAATVTQLLDLALGN